MTRIQQAARQALGLVDLTSLNDDDTDAVVRSLCNRARTPFGPVAAVCIYPRFIATARAVLAEHPDQAPVQIATVVNFPDGSSRIEQAVAETTDAVLAGADEIDLVFPWRALIDGDESTGPALIAACRQACNGRLLKVILETGELLEPALIRKASELAIDSGADFLKTSTGKVPVNATLPAAAIVLECIRDSGKDLGFKAAGGIRTSSEAAAYLALAEQIMGAGWINPRHFRFGASSLLDDLLATLDEKPAVKRPASDY
jgi:deoxyribose-phosphate aldolase